MAKEVKNRELAAEAAVMELVGGRRIEEIVVHSGVFHADEALDVAAVRMVCPDVLITRAFKAPEEAIGRLIADIGGGRYDHHQQGAATRADGNKRAAAGLVLEVLWPAIFPDEKSYREFERDFIVPIEDADNGVVANPLSLAISSFVPEWDSEETMDTAFLKAVDMLQGILEREVARAESRLRAEAGVREALEESDGVTVVLPRFMPWQSVLVPSTALFCVFPGARGGYNLQVVPAEEGSFAAKASLPKGWLEERPTGCTFVHQGRFLAAFDEEADAVEAARAVAHEFLSGLAAAVPEYEDFDMQDRKALHSAADAIMAYLRGGSLVLTGTEADALRQLVAEEKLWG